MGATEGASPTLTLLRHPQGGGLHFRILSLAERLRRSFLRGQGMEREGGWSQRLFPGPAQAGMDKIFEIKKKKKTSWLAPRSEGSPSLLMKERMDGDIKQGWEMAGIPQSLGPEGLRSGPTPQKTEDVFQSRVGCTDTEVLFAGCPRSPGIARAAGHPGAVTYATACVSRPGPLLPCPACTPASLGAAPRAPEGTGL